MLRILLTEQPMIQVGSSLTSTQPKDFVNGERPVTVHNCCSTKTIVLTFRKFLCNVVQNCQATTYKTTPSACRPWKSTT